MNDDWSWLIGEPNLIGGLGFMGLLLIFTPSKPCRVVGLIMVAICFLMVAVEDGYIKWKRYW